MLLAVDVGNTNVVFALFDKAILKARWRIATDPRRTGDEYAVWLLQLLDIEDIKNAEIDNIIIGSVVPRAVHNLTVLAEKYFSVTPLIAGQEPAGWTMAIDVEEPRSLGADRALNALAAHTKYGGDLIIIDFGTATTFDVVDFTGAYKGGIIAPGINLSLDALVSNTAKLPRVAIEDPGSSNVIGRNTEEQMLIGVFWGYVSLMEGLISRLKTQVGRPVKVVATGGLAGLFHQRSDLFYAVDTDLTLDGLAMLAGKVAAK